MGKSPILLAILDGVGITEANTGNAYAKAKKPNLERLMATYPTTQLGACGEAVGLPEGQMGNSEVGHLNLGAGRIVYQSLTLINKSIRDNEFEKNEVLVAAVEKAKANNSRLHIMGLLSDGGVHAHIDHIIALVKMAKTYGVTDVAVHAFLDGRDVAPTSSVTYLNQLQAAIDEIGVGAIASVSGRYYSMDRDKRWDRVELAYDAIVDGIGTKYTDVSEYVAAEYAAERFDEFVLPAVNANVDGTIQDGDVIINANFRPDRSIQLASVLTNPEYDSFTPKRRANDVTYVQMMKYADSVKSDLIAFHALKLTNGLGDTLAERGYNQLRIAETEKYAHVTFFFDGGVDKQLPNADRILVNSPKVATYDLQPEMSAAEVTEKLLAAIAADTYDVIILNYANCDMVGHTAVESAVIKAVETVDACIGQVADAVIAKGGVALITADHGNAEKILDENGKPFTAHTTNPVPLIVTKAGAELRQDGVLADLAPTILALLGEEQPAEMTGKTVIL
ncbi:MAG: 2,3-bisphosphoglycerate-independent phosphoglycerate mutase [Culicoidibacterales bacterium]